MSDKYPLKDLLRVRRFREDAAAAQVTKCRRAMEAAKEAIVSRKKELTDYQERRVQLEQNEYDAVVDQEIQLRDLDDLKLNIQLLRDNELAYHDRVREAQQHVVAAEKALMEAKEHYRAAVKDREKIDEHKEIWSQEMAKEAEANLEKEMEDFRVRKEEV